MKLKQIQKKRERCKKNEKKERTRKEVDLQEKKMR